MVEIETSVVTRVETLATLETVPIHYVRSKEERATICDVVEDERKLEEGPQIPVVDFQGLDSEDESVQEAIREQVKQAAMEWGVMQVVNHGISGELIDQLKAAGMAFFDLPMKQREVYANDPASGKIAGYGSKLANNANGQLEWVDYFFHLLCPETKRDLSVWPKEPSDYT